MFSRHLCSSPCSCSRAPTCPPAGSLSPQPSSHSWLASSRLSLFTSPGSEVGWPGVPPSPQSEWQPRWPEGKSLQTGSGPLVGGQSPCAIPATRHREVRQPPGKGPRAIPSYGKVRIPWNRGKLLPGARRPHWSDLQTDPTRQTVKDSRHRPHRAPVGRILNQNPGVMVNGMTKHYYHKWKVSIRNLNPSPTT